MNQDINILIEAYRQNLIKLTQSSQLPIGVVKYVLNDITMMINNEYNAYIHQVMNNSSAPVDDEENASETEDE